MSGRPHVQRWAFEEERTQGLYIHYPRVVTSKRKGSILSSLDVGYVSMERSAASSCSVNDISEYRSAACRCPASPMLRTRSALSASSAMDLANASGLGSHRKPVTCANQRE